MPYRPACPVHLILIPRRDNALAVLETVLLPLGSLKSLTNANLARGMLRLENHDTPGFQHDLLVNMKIARLINQHSSMIEHLVALSIDDSALQALQQAAVCDRLDAEQAAALQKIVQDLGPIPFPAGSINHFERYFGLDVICSIRHNGPHGSLAEIKPLLWVVPLDYNAALRQANDYYDQLTHAWDLPSFSDRKAAFDKIENRIDSEFKSVGLTQRLLHPHTFILGIILPGYKNVNNLDTRCLADRHLALTALALRSYKLQHTHFPDSLAELPAAPYFQDPFTDQPLVYRRQADGYLLYSLAENQKDDGGVARSDANRKDFDMPLEASR